MIELGVSILIVFILSFLIQYFIISYITSYSLFDITFNTGKLYISLINAIHIVIIQIFLYNIYDYKMNKYIYLPFFIILIILIILYRGQIYIDDNEYLKEMIDYNSMELLISEKIKNKTSNKEIKELSNNFIISKKREIEDMKNIIKDNETINKIKESES